MRPPSVLLIVALLITGQVVAQSTPPEVINYQGVLRNADGSPREGSHDMVFRFFEVETDGTHCAFPERTTRITNPRIGGSQPCQNRSITVPALVSAILV